MTTVEQKNLVTSLKAEIAEREGFVERGTGDDIIMGYKSKSLWKGTVNVLIAEIEPGMKKAAHAHPGSDSVIIMLEGEGEYFMGSTAVTKSIKVGDVMIAPAGSLHGVYNTGTATLRYICTEGPTPVEFVHEGSWND